MLPATLGHTPHAEACGYTDERSAAASAPFAGRRLRLALWPLYVPSAMQIYLIRHAHAVDAAEDPKRPLSKKGHKQVKRLAKFLRKNEAIATSEFWHSPLARSRETAERLTAQIGAPAKLLEVTGLEGGDDPAKIAERLKNRKTPVAVVGHEPQLSALASLLVVGATEPPRFVLKKSAVVALDRAEGGWAIRWQISPELL